MIPRIIFRIFVFIVYLWKQAGMYDISCSFSLSS